MEVDDGGDLGSLSINNQDSSFNSQDSIQVPATSSSNRQQSQSASSDRDRPVKSDKEKKSKSKSKEKEIPIRKQGGSLPENKNQSQSATSTSTSTSTTSSIHASVSNPPNNPSKTIPSTISNPPPQPHRSTSSSNNSINSNKTTTSSSSSKSNQSSSTSKDAVGGSRLNSVKEKMSEGWYRTVGSIKDRDRDSSSGNRSSNYRDDRRRSSASTSQGQGQGDLSIPFSSLDESLSRDKDSSEINRHSISSNRTLNGNTTTSTINSQNKVSTNDQSKSSTTTTSSSSFSRRNSAKKDQEKEKETSMERLGLGNKFGLGGKVSNASPIDTSSSASKKEKDTSEVTSPISPSTGKKQKRRRGSKSITSPTKDRDQSGKKGDNSEPSSPVPPRRTSLNISRNDYLKLGLDNENQRREEKELEGLGLETMNSTKQTQTKIQSPTSSSSRSRSQSTSKLSSKTTSTSTNPTSINTDPSSDKSTFSIALLQRYVLSIGIVNFDLDLGPDLEFLYPPLGISREERDNIAFSSFPDTSIFDDGSCVFSWRVREVPLDNSKEGPPIIGKGKGKEKETSIVGENERENERNSRNKDQDTIGRSSTPTGQRGGGSGSGRLSTNYIYGYVFFRQKRDSRIRRGYFQKSLVILSHLPYVSLFEKLVRILGTLFFEEPSLSCSDKNKNSLGEEKDETQDLKILTSFCQNVTCWPEPIPGELITLDLPFLNQYNSKSTSNSSLLDISSLIVSLPNSFSSSQTSSLNDEYLLPPSTSAAGRPNSLLISKTKSSNKGSIGVGAGKEFKLKNEIGQTKENPLLANIPSRNLFDTFREVLPDLWLLWECLLLADPILIMAPDPSRCSEAIWHAIDLIRPIPFAGDFRPFFTMQDHDVSILVNKNKPQSGTLLGVTNPFFKQACDHWSSTLRVGKGGLSNEEKEKIEMEERERNHSSNHNKGFHFHHSNHTSSRDNGSSSNSSNAGYSSISQANSMSNSNSIPVGRVAGGNSAGGGGPDHTPGFTTKRKRRVSKDRPLLRRLLEMAEKRDTDLAANALLRRYFSSLTEMFLAPLNRYVSTLIPADFDLSSPIETPRLKPFSTNDFLTSLKAHGTPISLKSKNLPTGNNIRQSLYVDFLNCPNFSLWLTERLNQAEEEQRKRRINVLENDDVIKFAKNKGEIESLDLYERLVEEIKRIDERLNQPITLGPSSRWRTDNPNASSGQGHKNTSSETSITSSLSGFKSLEKVTSRDSTGTNNSENFVDARSSISSSNYLSDHSDSKTPTMIRKGEEFNTLKNGTTSSGLISGRSTPTTSTSRGVSNSYSSTSTNNQINVKQLKDRKVKLLKQLEKLVETFPEDLKTSLRVKP